MADEVRVLHAGDEPALFAFLEQHLESSVVLLSNAGRAGLRDRGEVYEGTYAAAFSSAEITAVAAHYWNGNLLVQGELGLDAAARLAVSESKRSIGGILGPLPAVRRVRVALGLHGTPARCDYADRLFVLELDRLRVPELLNDPRFEVRGPSEAEVPELARWRADYNVEILGAEYTPELERWARQDMERMRRSGNGWVLVHDGKPVAFAAFAAEARGIVQIGGVYTPPPLRRNGYARAAVGASLLRARERGVKKSTLFTSPGNTAALRAYTTLGYEPRGDFALVLFR